MKLLVMLSAFFVGAVVFSSDVAVAQQGCYQLPRGERRIRCLEFEARVARQEEQSWRDAERQIDRNYSDACNAVGVVGSAAGIGGQARTACRAPYYYDQGQREYEERQRRAGPQDHSPETYFREARRRNAERQRQFDREQDQYREQVEERRRRRKQ